MATIRKNKNYILSFENPIEMDSSKYPVIERIECIDIKDYEDSENKPLGTNYIFYSKDSPYNILSPSTRIEIFVKTSSHINLEDDEGKIRVPWLYGCDIIANRIYPDKRKLRKKLEGRLKLKGISPESFISHLERHWRKE